MKVLENSRFYILMGSFLISLFTLSILRGQIPSDQLFYIRLEQVFGFFSLTLIYFAVILTPLSKLVRDNPLMSRLLFARRAIGVSAAYFAAGHVYISFFFQEGSFTGLSLLPGRFVFAFLLGTISLIILLLMAATSFDKAVQIMTFKNWKRLHKFVYLAGILIIVHVWLIGTHTEYAWVKIGGFAALVVLFALETLRVYSGLRAKKQLPQAEASATAFGLFVVLTGGLLLLPIVSQSYHSSHHNQSGHGSNH